MAVSVMAPLLLFVAAAAYDYTKEKSDARRQVVATADALAEHAQKVIDTSMLVQTMVAERIGAVSWDRMAGDVDLHAFLVRIAQSLPQFESVYLIGPDGRIASSSRSLPATPFDVRERAYFRAAVSGNGRMVVSDPFRGEIKGTPAFTVSRAINPATPQSGIIAVTLSPDYFLQFYATVAQAETDTRATLIRSDGVFLVRYPAGGQTTQLNGDSGITVEQIATQASGLVESRGKGDAGTRLIAFHQLATAPLVATYSISLRAALADWYRHVAVLAAFATGLAGVLAYAARGAMLRASEERRSLRPAGRRDDAARAGRGCAAPVAEDGGAGQTDRRRCA